MKFLNFSLASLLITSLLAISSSANATVVLFKTNMGDFEVNLLDEHTPETVANFIRYIEANSYDNSIFHRSVPNFIIQGGGFNYNIESKNVTDGQKFNSVKNEPIFSNVLGTIAMAKLGNNENSATNQWFFNTQDNSSNLDLQNGGFTVFGVVTSGMNFINDINELPQYTISGLPAFTQTPLKEEPTNNSINEDHYVLVESIEITNYNSDTYTDIPVHSVIFSQSTINAGKDFTVKTDEEIILNGSTTLNIEDLSYHWEVIKKPENSTFNIQDNDTLTPTFSANMTGEYILELKVSHDHLESYPDTLKITVQNDDQTDLPSDEADKVDDSSSGGTTFWLLTILSLGLIRRAVK